MGKLIFEVQADVQRLEEARAKVEELGAALKKCGNDEAAFNKLNKEFSAASLEYGNAAEKAAQSVSRFNSAVRSSVEVNADLRSTAAEWAAATKAIAEVPQSIKAKQAEIAKLKQEIVEAREEEEKFARGEISLITSYNTDEAESKISELEDDIKAMSAQFERAFERASKMPQELSGIAGSVIDDVEQRLTDMADKTTEAAESAQVSVDGVSWQKAEAALEFQIDRVLQLTQNFDYLSNALNETQERYNALEKAGASAEQLLPVKEELDGYKQKLQEVASNLEKATELQNRWGVAIHGEKWNELQSETPAQQKPQKPQRFDQLTGGATGTDEQLSALKDVFDQKQAEVEEYMRGAAAARDAFIEEIQKIGEADEEFKEAVKNGKLTKEGIEKEKAALERLESAAGKSASGGGTIERTIQANVFALVKLREMYDQLRVAKEDAEKAGAGGEVLAYLDARMNLTQELINKTETEGAALQQAKSKGRDYVSQIHQDLDALTNAQQGAGAEVEQKAVSIRQQIAQVREEMIRLAENGEAGSERFQELAEKAADLKKELDGVNAQIEFESNPTGGLEAVKEGLQGIAGAAGLAEGILGLFNTESEEMQEIQTRIQSLLGIIVGLEEAYGMVKKANVVILGIQKVQTLAAAKAKALETSTTVGATIAQKAFNLVANANPYVLLATAVLTVVGAIGAFIMGSKKSAEEEKKAQEAAEAAKKSAEERAEAEKRFAESVASNAGESITSYNKLRAAWNALGNDLNAKEKFVRDNQDAFHSLGFAVDNVTQAENFLVNNTGAVVSALMARAKAKAYEARLQKMTEDYIAEDEKLHTPIRYRSYKEMVGRDVNALKTQDADSQKILNEMGTRHEMYEAGYIDKNGKITSKGAQYMSGQSHNINFERRVQAKIENDKNYTENFGKAVEGLAKATDDQQAELKKIQGAGVRTYTPPKRTSGGGRSGGSGGGKNDEEERKKKIAEAEKNILKIEADNLKARRENTAKAIEEVYDAELDAMQEGGLKTELLRERQLQKELQEIDRKRDAEIEAEVERQKKLFEAKQKLAEAKGEKVEEWDDSKIDQAYIKQITDTYKSLSDTHATNNEKELAKMRVENLRAYLKEYGTVQQKAYAIASEYNEKIAAEADENAKRSLEKKRTSELAAIKAQELAGGIDWTTAFEGVGTALNAIAKETLAKVNEYMKTDEYKNLSASDKQQYVSLRQSLTSQVGEASNPFALSTWKEIGTKTQEYADAVRAVQEATTAHNAAMDALTEAEEAKQQAQNTLAAEQKKQVELNRELAQAEEDLKNATDDAAKAEAKSKRDQLKKDKDAQDTAVKVAETIVATLEQNVASKQEAADATGATLQQKTNEEDEAEQGVKDASDKAAQGLNNFTTILSQLNSGTLAGFANGVANLINVLFKGGNAMGDALQGIAGKAGGIIGAILQIIDAMGDDPSEFISGIFDKIIGAVDGILEQLFSGELVMVILNGVGRLIETILDNLSFGLFSGLFGGNESEIEDKVEDLTESNSYLEKALQELTRELQTASGLTAIEIAEQKKRTQQEKTANDQEILALEQSKHGSHHSNNYYINKEMTSSDWDYISKLLGKNITEAADLWTLTPEELAKLQANTSIWQKIAGSGEYDNSAYLEAYIDDAEAIEQIEEDLQEAVMGVSWEGFYENYLSMLQDLDSENKDFADNLEEYIKNAVLSGMLSDMYSDRLKEMYNRLYGLEKQYSEGKMSDEQYAAAIDEYQADFAALTQEILDERARLVGTLGLDTNADQSATASLIKNITADQADKLIGRLTAIQIAVEYGNILREGQAANGNTMHGQLSQMTALGQQHLLIADEIRTLMATSYSQLVQINENTGAVVSPIKGMFDDLADLKKIIKDNI